MDGDLLVKNGIYLSPFTFNLVRIKQFNYSTA